jgi:hypothetical protein
MELENILYYAADAMVFISNSIIILGVVTNPPVKMLVVTIYLFIIYMLGGMAAYIIVFVSSIAFIIFRRRYDRKMQREVEDKEKEYMAKKRGTRYIR